MAPHSSTLAWKLPWMVEPGRLQSMGSLRVGHDWATSLCLSLSCIREGNGNPLQCSGLENPRDGGAWWAAIHGVAQSRTRLKWLSSRAAAKPSLYLKFTSSEGDYIFDDLQSPQHEFYVYLISSILHQAIPYIAQLFFDKLIQTYLNIWLPWWLRG